MEKLKSLLSSEYQAIVDVLMLLQRTHTELLNIYNDTEREVKGIWRQKKNQKADSSS